MRLTYRTSRVLAGVAELGGRGSDPSNRQVGEYAGIADAGQVSKLLRRLERLGAAGQRWRGALQGRAQRLAAHRQGRAGRVEHPRA